MLKIDKVSANFTWVSIRSLTVYIGANDVTAINVKGDSIDDKAKKIFERLGLGNTVIIEVEACNKNNQRVPWASMSMIVR